MLLIDYMQYIASNENTIIIALAQFLQEALLERYIFLASNNVCQMVIFNFMIKVDADSYIK